MDTQKNISSFTELRSDLASGTMHGSFRVEHAEVIEEIDGSAYVFTHVPTQARVLWLACANTERTFAIGFKTPPSDDTGIFHIIEHSVLCGSERFPTKDPFVYLLKTSLNTFLNAITFADKTMYPVATTNIRDLKNLMDVYLDAVFHPRIHTCPHIFEQEAWHLEISDDKTLAYNGVVFNEMKGALSDPDARLMNELNRALFPESPYHFESGGDPRSIPDLTYEEFTATHRRHYTPKNSYSIFYGDLDIDDMLAHLENHLAGAAAYNENNEANPLPCQNALAAPYRAFSLNTAPENASIALGYVLDTNLDHEHILAVSILLDAIAGSNEAPLKRAVLDAHLGDELLYSFSDDIMQPTLTFRLKGARPNVAEEFRTLIENTCRSLTETGIGHDRLASALAQAEFALREYDWEGLPTGLVLSIISLSTWLYRDEDSTVRLHYNQELAHLHAQLDTGYFEQILGDVTFACPHSALVELVPTTEVDPWESTKLEAIREHFTEKDMADLAEHVKALRTEQTKPDSPEDIARLPRLTLSDIAACPDEPCPQHIEEAPVPCYFSDIPTHQIDYVHCYAHLAHMAWEDLPYVSILSILLGKLDTAQHTAAELDTYIDINIGHLSFQTKTYGREDNSSEAHPYLVVSASVLSELIAKTADIFAEIMRTTKFDDTRRICDILTQHRIALEQGFINSGHAAALSRLSSHHNAAARIEEHMSGIDFYWFLKDLLENFDARIPSLKEKLTSLLTKIFTVDNIEVSFAGTREDLEHFWGGAEAFTSKGDMPNDSQEKTILHTPAAPQNTNEAFITPSDICFVTYGAPLEGPLSKASGEWKIMANILDYEYLWYEIRVQGGAYGCRFGLTQTSMPYLFSYRDPAVDPTLTRFRAIASWLKKWQPTTPEEFEGHLIATIAAHDKPLKAADLAERIDSLRLLGRSPEWRTHIRKQILEATPETIREYAEAFASLEKTASICVLGGRAIVSDTKEKLDVIELVDDGQCQQN